MSPRGSIDPAVIAAITERAPARLRKKLDGAPRVADGWSWVDGDGATVVTTDAGDRVTLTHEAGVVASIDSIACSCLLGPKCFHVLAAAAALAIAEGAAAGASAGPATVDVGASRTLAPAENAAVRSTLDALGRALAAGLSAIGALDRAAILRAVHASRVAGLHRLAARSLAFAEAARALRERSESFDLDEAIAALGDALTTARRLERGETDAGTIGVARRAYEPIGGVRLVGFACEPVVTRSGYAGIVSYVATEKGRIYTIEDVMPGGAERALASYAATLRLGEASLTHRALSRQGLFLTGATASADDRLGAGASVAAVSGAGATFAEPPLSALFEVPLALQIERALAGPRRGLVARSASLVFFEGTVLGLDAGGVVFAADAAIADESAVLRLVASAEDRRLATNENLRVLGGAVGLRLRVVGHVAGPRAGTIEVVTVAPSGPGLELAASAGGKVHVAFDQLTRAQVSGGACSDEASAEGTALTTRAPARPSEALAALDRRVGRTVVGGRRALTARAAHAVADEVGALRRAFSPTAARALERLLAASASPSLDAAGLVEAWLAAFVVSESTRTTLARAEWRRVVGPSP